MEYFIKLEQAIMYICDPLFSWLLLFPMWLAVVIVGLCTAFILTIMRKWLADQDLLWRCKRDKRTLKKRIRALKNPADHVEASRTVDKLIKTCESQGVTINARARVALQKVVEAGSTGLLRERLKSLIGCITLKTMAQEWRPLLFAIVPIALLGTWCFGRLAFHPPQTGEQIEIIAHFPDAEVGQFVHLLPQDGMQIENGCIREIESEHLGGASFGVAAWKLSAHAAENPYPIIIRGVDVDYSHELLVGSRYYSRPLLILDDTGERAIELRMQEVQVAGIPGWPAYFLPAWLLAYILVTIPAVPLFRWSLKVA